MEVFDKDGNSLGFFAEQDDFSLIPCCSTPSCENEVFRENKCYSHLNSVIKEQIEKNAEESAHRLKLMFEEREKEKIKEKTIRAEEKAFSKRIKKLLDRLSDKEPKPKPTLSFFHITMLKYSPEANAKREERRKKRENN